MRTLESKIKAAILHPEEEVRLTALTYFSRFHGEDDSIMPLVIEAVEKYGRNRAFRILRRADELSQTEATIQWLTAELAKDWDLDNIRDDNYCTAIALILCDARPDLLKPEFVDLPGFPQELRGWLAERLEMASWDWKTGWSALEVVGEEIQEQGRYPLQHSRRATRIIESLARHGEKGDRILPLLHRHYQGYEEDLMEWLEPYVVELAGRMRLEAAVPILVERMLEDDFDLGDRCAMALPWIGGDLVVQTLAEHWSEAEGDYRRGAAEAMENVHTDSSVQKCLEFFAVEEDQDNRDSLAYALLGNFAEESVEPIRQMIEEDEEDFDPELADLKYRLTAVATIMGVSFPGYEEWYKEAVEENWGWGEGVFDRHRIRENFRDDVDEEDWEEEDWEDDEADEYDDDLEADADDRLFGQEAIRHEQPKVGRNDPCPCGSGKKYKKCCLNKQRSQQAEEVVSKFPIGTVALYGPDDRKTTKIVASVIKREGADPMLRRWVGSNVKENYKVRREIKEFFEQYGVKSVVMTDRNMGCPHEEGKDFPHGGDCPFCPYWKGKQGSGAKQ
jgi:hypothetical protein